MSFLRQNAPFLSAGFLLTFGSAFGQTFFISLFAGEIRAEFGLSHAAWGSIYALGTCASAAIMVWAGMLTDRWRVRSLGFWVLCLSAVASLAMALTPSAVFLVLTVLLLRLSGQGMMTHLATVAMSRWFVASRGRALSVAALGYNVAEAFLPIAVVTLLTFIDWRLIWVLAALVSLALIPILHRLLRLERNPHTLSQDDESTGLGGRHWTRSEVLRHPLFWFLVPALLGPPAFNTAFFFQQVFYVETKGWTHQAFVAMIPIYTAVGVAAMLVWGRLVDRFGSARLIWLYQFPGVLAFIVFAQAGVPGALALGFMCLGIMNGANAILPNAFWAEHFGTRHIGSIKAMASAIMVFASAVGPFLTGLLISFEVPLPTQYLWVSIYFALTCLSVWCGLRLVKQRSAAAP